MILVNCRVGRCDPFLAGEGGVQTRHPAPQRNIKFMLVNSHT
jgi:hypothetical protein